MQYTALIACKGMKMMTTMLEVAKKKKPIAQGQSANGAVHCVDCV
ncbi:transcriptional regulator [Escherichia coli SHECO001]|nr:transcriptional regulator [Escherichia coli SHECO001]